MLYGLNISHFSCLTPHTMPLHITLLSRKGGMLYWPELLHSTSHYPLQYPVSYNNNNRINRSNYSHNLVSATYRMSRLYSPPLSFTNTQPAKYSRGGLAVDIYWYHSFPPKDFAAERALEVYFSHSHISIQPGALACLLKLEQPARSVLFKHIRQS